MSEKKCANVYRKLRNALEWAYDAGEAKEFEDSLRKLVESQSLLKNLGEACRIDVAKMSTKLEEAKEAARKESHLGISWTIDEINDMLEKELEK
jgi:hypothetical protein